MEIKNIVGYEGLYVITDQGQVFNIKTNRFIGNRSDEENHYIMVCLVDFNGIPHYEYVHRLMAKTFMPVDNCDVLEVNHKNGIKSDNSLENLEWVTHRENVSHYWKQLHKASGNSCKKVIGINPNDETDILEFDSMKQAAEYYGHHSSTISKAISRGSRSAGRYWKLVEVEKEKEK